MLNDNDAGKRLSDGLPLLRKIHPQRAHVRFRARRLHRHLHVLSELAQTVEQICFTHAPKLAAQDERKLGLRQAHDARGFLLRELALGHDCSDAPGELRLEKHRLCIRVAQVRIDVACASFDGVCSVRNHAR